MTNSLRCSLFMGMVLSLPSVVPAGSSTIYKCVVDGSTQYQNVPCDGTSSGIDVPGASGRRDTMSRQGSETPSVDIGPAPWAQVGEIGPGVSDTVVLNRAGWGRPSAISRSRGPEGFREAWRYAASGDGAVRILHFLNGRLMALEVEPVPTVSLSQPASEDIPSRPVMAAAAMPVSPRMSSETSTASELPDDAQGAVPLIE